MKKTEDCGVDSLVLVLKVTEPNPGEMALFMGVTFHDAEDKAYLLVVNLKSSLHQCTPCASMTSINGVCRGAGHTITVHCSFHYSTESLLL